LQITLVSLETSSVAMSFSNSFISTSIPRIIIITFFRKGSKKMNVIEALKAVKKLLQNPNHWTKGANARDINESSVNGSNPEAVKFCLIGAFDKLQWHYEELSTIDNYFAIADAKNYLRNAIGSAFISDFNDNSTHKQIITALNKAILLAKKENTQ